MSAQDDKNRNRPEADQSTRRTAEDELMRGERNAQGERRTRFDRGVGQTGDGEPGGSGTGGQGIENEGTGSLLISQADAETPEADRPAGEEDAPESGGSGSTKGGRAPGVSGQRGMTGGLEKEGAGHSGPIRSGSQRENNPGTEQNRAADGNEEENARDGYEDHGSSRDADGTQGESSGSRPGYR